MRTHFCGDLSKATLDQEVTLCGWVNRRRDHGGVIFLDVRDKRGIAQVVINPDTESTFAIAESVRNEFVLKIKGKVIARDEAMINSKIPTGEIEVVAEEIDILNVSKLRYVKDVNFFSNNLDFTSRYFAIDHCLISCNNLSFDFEYKLVTHTLGNGKSRLCVRINNYLRNTTFVSNVKKDDAAMIASSVYPAT